MTSTEWCPDPSGLDLSAVVGQPDEALAPAWLLDLCAGLRPTGIGVVWLPDRLSLLPTTADRPVALADGVFAPASRTPGGFSLTASPSQAPADARASLRWALDAACQSRRTQSALSPRARYAESAKHFALPPLPDRPSPLPPPPQESPAAIRARERARRTCERRRKERERKRRYRAKQRGFDFPWVFQRRGRIGHADWHVAALGMLLEDCDLQKKLLALPHASPERVAVVQARDEGMRQLSSLLLASPDAACPPKLRADAAALLAMLSE